MRFPLIALAITLAAASLAGPALAGEARASGNVPVRLGPGSGYPVVDRLVNGNYYEVEDCTRQSRWCFVSDDGEDLGWVRGSSMVGSAAKNRVTPFEFLVTPRFPFN
jgi:uncharacterized protein YraI